MWLDMKKAEVVIFGSCRRTQRNYLGKGCQFIYVKMNKKESDFIKRRNIFVCEIACQEI